MGSTDLKRDGEPCYLVVHLDKHLDWESHINSVVSTYHEKLSSVRKMKNFMPFSTRIMLAESLLLSEIDFNDYIYSPLKQYQLKKLHRLQKAIASPLRIRWLPIAERREN